MTQNATEMRRFSSEYGVIVDRPGPGATFGRFFTAPSQQAVLRGSRLAKSGGEPSLSDLARAIAGDFEHAGGRGQLVEDREKGCGCLLDGDRVVLIGRKDAVDSPLHLAVVRGGRATRSQNDFVEIFHELPGRQGATVEAMEKGFDIELSLCFSLKVEHRRHPTAATGKIIHPEAKVGKCIYSAQVHILASAPAQSRFFVGYARAASSPVIDGERPLAGRDFIPIPVNQGCRAIFSPQPARQRMRTLAYPPAGVRFSFEAVESLSTIAGAFALVADWKPNVVIARFCLNVGLRFRALPSLQRLPLAVALLRKLRMSAWASDLHCQNL